MEGTARRVIDLTSARIGHLGPAGVEAHLLAQDSTLIDIRGSDEREEQGWIAGSIHVPREQLVSRADPGSPMYLTELDPHRRTIVHCGNGDRAAHAAGTLVSLGYLDVAELAGGIEAWQQAGAPIAGLEPWHRGHDERR